MITPAITGVGAITPAGRGVAASWQGVRHGRPTAATDEALAEAGAPVTITCRAPSFDPSAELGRGASRRLDRFTHLAVLAATEALEQAGLVDTDGRIAGADPDRVGIVLGSGIGGAESWAAEYPNFLEKGPDRISPTFIPRMLSNTAAGTIAIRTGARGPNLTVNTACAAGATAIHVARDLVRSGTVDVAIAGGAEAGITDISISAFAQMGALSRNPDPASASRPFDQDRDGFVMGEGAGIMVLESAANARARGAEVLGRVAGAGGSADAHHQTAPPDDGGGAVLAMQRALDDADIAPTDIAHVNAHGTSTPLNDRAEGRAIRAVLGDHTDEVAVTSTKGVTGHLLGAAGAAEAIFALMALRDSQAPPTAGLAHQDPEIALDVVSGSVRHISAEAVLTNSFGFGGQNASLVLTS